MLLARNCRFRMSVVTVSIGGRADVPQTSQKRRSCGILAMRTPRQMHGARRSLSRLSITRCLLGDEGVTRSDVRLEHLTRHFPPDHVVKRLAHAVRRHEVVRIDLLECRDHLPEVVVVQRWNEMEAADHRVYVLYAGCGLGLSARVDDSAVAARGHDDQSLVLEHEVGPDLMLEIIWNKGSGVLCRGDFVRETAKPINDADFLCCIAKRLFESALCNFSGGEGMIGDNGRPFCHH